MEKREMRKEILIHISELLAERGMISSLEEHAVKDIIGQVEMQEFVSFRNGEEIGKSGDL